MSELPPLPVADGPTGWEILKGLVRDRSLLTGLSLMYKYVGHAFQITLPRFKPAVLVGPETNRQILVRQRHKLLWRNETDPVVKLLRHGVLVVDGQEHDDLRDIMDPLLQRKYVVPHISAFWSYTNQITSAWQPDEIRDMLVEMRKIALLILFGTLFKVDLTPDMERLWQPILDLIEYISPGLWIVFPKMPRHPKYSRARQEMDGYLYNLIRRRRADLEVAAHSEVPDDLLSKLVSTSGLSDDLIRDQLLTMLIAGHDTSTALLAWTLFLLGKYPQAMVRTRDEVDAVLGNSDDPPNMDQINHLVYTDQVIKEALRLYPPIHVGNRNAAEDINLHGYHIPAETRVMYSIFLSHRQKKHWHDPESFVPERFDRQSDQHRPAFTYVPFGGGPRNCIGAVFAQVESKVVIARLLQLFNFELLNGEEVRPYMGATLEPRPGVKMRVRRRANHA